MDVRVSSQPSAMFRLMGVEVIQNGMQLFVGVDSDHPVHEVHRYRAGRTDGVIFK